jgi:hypothetical protein
MAMDMAVATEIGTTTAAGGATTDAVMKLGITYPSEAGEVDALT